jgi:hypothetical protein
MTSQLDRAAGDTLRVNERLKAFSAVVTNLGSALLAAAAARWFRFGL